MSVDYEGVMIELGAMRDRWLRRFWKVREHHKVLAVSHGHATYSTDGRKLFLWAAEPISKYHLRDVRVELDEKAVMRLLEAIADIDAA